jgi:protein-L-isoaspartate O-methyltransferase
MKSRKPTVINEIKEAKISPGEKILVIGSGIFPSTPILISEILNNHVIGVDNNIKAVNLAKSYIEKKGLNKKIEIKYGDGTCYPVKEYDLVFVVINVWPLHTVLEHLAKNMKSGSRLICRGIKNDISSFYNEKKLSQAFALVSSSEFPMTTFSKYPMTQSLLFIKK